MEVIPEVLQASNGLGALALVWLASALTAGNTDGMGRLCSINPFTIDTKRPRRLNRVDVE